MKAQIVKNTFNKLIENKVSLTKALLWVLVALMMVDYIIPLIMKEYFQKTPSPSAILGPILMLNVIISITSHRLFLLGDGSVSTWGMGKFTKQRELKFFFKAILLALIVVIPSFIIFFILNIFIGFSGLNNIVIIEEITVGLMVNVFLTAIAVSYIASRVSLVFPSIAVDKPIGFTDSWEITRDYQWVMFSSVIIFPIVFATILTLVYGVVIGFLAELISSHLFVLSSLLNLFITVFSIGFLSSAYEYIMNEKAQESIYLEIENRKKKEEPREIKIYDSSDTYKMKIHDAYDITFEDLQKELFSQYEKLGFNDFAIDRENCWMLKNPKQETSYVYLKYEGDEFQVETFGTEKPKLNILD